MLRILGILVLLLVVYLVIHDGNPVTSTVSPTRIDKILATPQEFDGKAVTVRGVVTGSLGLMGVGGYHVRDPNGQRQLFVLSVGGVPPSGSTVTITGIFREAVTVGTYRLPVILLKP